MGNFSKDVFHLTPSKNAHAGGLVLHACASSMLDLQVWGNHALQ